MARASELLEGPLASALPQYEARPSQLQMADAVAAALANEQVLFCEAGTGTGKTLAYLLPALLSGKRVVVSTATRALQDQLVDKDVPLAERVLKRPVRVTVLKGLSNYLCKRRYGEFRSSSDSARPGVGLKLRALEVWQEDTEYGDLSELAGIAESDPLLEAVRSSSDTRLGSKCPHYEQCFVTKVKRAAEESELVITNHHLFFADLALRGPHPGRVLPDYDAVIFDEAHQIEDVATLFFGVRVSQRRILNLSRDAARLLGEARGGALTGPNITQQVNSAAERFFDSLARIAKSEEPRVRLDDEVWASEAHDRYLELDSALEGLESTAELGRNDVEADAEGQQSEAWETVFRRAQGLREALATIVEGAAGRVNWFDNDKSSKALSSSAVDLSEVLRERLFNRVPSIVLTSATLTASPGRLGSDEQTPFAFTRARLGAFDCEPEVVELVVESPFDFRKHALLYVPRNLPAPNEVSFLDAALNEIEQLVNASDGGAFVLTTSLRSMRALHKGLKERLENRPVLLQGSAPKQALLSAFRNSGRAVLVATMSFWEGVDVPGSALRLVILEKIPFAVPSDPILQARAAALEEEGQRAFAALFLPLAQMTLKQGFGRLIRTRNDRGVVALLDSRVHTRGYGQRLLSQLPPARRTVEQADALAFLTETQTAVQ